MRERGGGGGMLTPLDARWRCLLDLSSVASQPRQLASDGVTSGHCGPDARIAAPTHGQAGALLLTSAQCSMASARLRLLSRLAARAVVDFGVLSARLLKHGGLACAGDSIAGGALSRQQAGAFSASAGLAARAG